MPTLLDRLSLYRVIFVIFVFTPAALLAGASANWLLTKPVLGFVFPIIAEMVLTFIYLLTILRFPSLRLNRGFLAIQFILDAVILTVPIALSDGTASAFTALYVVLILVAALTHSYRFALTMSLLSCSLVAAISYFEVNGMLPGIAPIKNIVQIREVLTRDLVYFGMFFVLGLLPARLTERVRTADANLIDLQRDYALAQELNRVVVEHVPAGIAIVDAEQRLIMLNGSGRKLLTTLAPSDKLSMTLAHLATAGDQNQIEFQDPETLATITLAVNITPLSPNVIDGGKLIIFQDISQRKRIEQRLEEERRLAAIGQLSANLAHEVRNPLAAISNSAQILKKQVERDPKIDTLLTIQEREIERLERLVSDFLLFARPRFVDCGALQIEHLIKQAIERFRLDPQHAGHPLHVADFSQLPAVMVAPDLFRQAFDNVLVNALYWSKPNEPVRVDGYVEAGFLAIVIENVGDPIPAELRDRIFEPFVSGRPTGTGLGLAIAWAAMAGMGGQLDLLRSDASGTAFVLRLKIAQDA